jgi:hypothetical protein
MRTRHTFALCASPLALVGCQYLADLQTHVATEQSGDAGPSPDAQQDVQQDTEEDAASPGCVLANDGSARVRFGNLAPDYRAVDVCLKPSGKGSWDDVVPITRGTGADCPAGIRYPLIVSPVGVEPGTYDARVVDAQDGRCEAEPLSELHEIHLTSGTTHTLVRIGGGDVTESMVVHQDAPATSLSTLIRFLHAALGTDRIEAGITTEETWPTEQGLVVYPNVAFGGTAAGAPSPFGMIDDRGYVDTWTGGAYVTYGVSLPGSVDLLAMRRFKLPMGSNHTLFAIGSASDPAFPAQLIACGDADVDGILTRCTEGSRPRVSVLSWDVQLDGAFAPYPLQRVDAVAEALAKESTADVVCLQNVYREEDRALVLEATKNRYPHAYLSEEDETTPFDDPTNAQGEVPEPPSTPPCGTEDLGTLAQEAIDCMVERCSAVPGDPSQSMLEGNCLINRCVSTLLPLAYGSPEHARCFACLLYTLSGYASYEQTLEACEQDPHAGYAFGGQNGQIVLSAFPLGEGETWTLPSTSWRVSVARVPVHPPDGPSFDVYCTVTGNAARPLGTQPYTGRYGDGPFENPWTNEAYLQNQKLVSFVRSRSGPTPAVVAGEFYTGPGYEEGGQQRLEPVAPEVFDLLSSSFGLGVSPNHVPSCTNCAENPLVGGAPETSTWISHLFSSGIPRAAILRTDRTFLTANVPIDVGGSDVVMTPPSPRFGLLSTIEFRP